MFIADGVTRVDVSLLAPDEVLKVDLPHGAHVSLRLNEAGRVLVQTYGIEHWHVSPDEHWRNDHHEDNAVSGCEDLFRDLNVTLTPYES